MRRRTRYGVLFAVLAAGLAVSATGELAWPVRFLAGSGAVCCATLSLAYLTARPGLVGKRRDGSLHPLFLALCWPYWVANGLLLLLWDRLYPQAPCHEVVPGLWLGRFPLASSRMPASVGAVVDLTCELPRSGGVRGRAYLALPTLDATPLAEADLDQGCRFIDEERRKHPVLVHCALGHGRSATLVAAYLIHSGSAATPADALDRIQGVRPAARPNAEQWAGLTAWAGRRG